VLLALAHTRPYAYAHTRTLHIIAARLTHYNVTRGIRLAPSSTYSAQHMHQGHDQAMPGKTGRCSTRTANTLHARSRSKHTGVHNAAFHNGPSRRTVSQSVSGECPGKGGATRHAFASTAKRCHAPHSRQLTRFPSSNHKYSPATPTFSQGKPKCENTTLSTGEPLEHHLISISQCCGPVALQLLALACPCVAGQPRLGLTLL